MQIRSRNRVSFAADPVDPPGGVEIFGQQFAGPEEAETSLHSGSMWGERVGVRITAPASDTGKIAFVCCSPSQRFGWNVTKTEIPLPTQTLPVNRRREVLPY